MNRFFAYISEARAELTRVTWPTRQQAFRLTIAVVLFSVAFSLVIGGLDYVFTNILQKLILKV